MDELELRGRDVSPTASPGPASDGSRTAPGTREPIQGERGGSEHLLLSSVPPVGCALRVEGIEQAQPELPRSPSALERGQQEQEPDAGHPAERAGPPRPPDRHVQREPEEGAGRDRGQVDPWRGDRQSGEQEDADDA